MPSAHANSPRALLKTVGSLLGTIQCPPAGKWFRTFSATYMVLSKGALYFFAKENVSSVRSLDRWMCFGRQMPRCPQSPSASEGIWMRTATGASVSDAIPPPPPHTHTHTHTQAGVCARAHKPRALACTSALYINPNWSTVDRCACALELACGIED